MTYLGSAICSQRRRTIGAILIVARPATMMRSAGRGVARGMIPIRSRSNRLAYAAIISIAQQASPNVSGQIDEARPQLSAASTVVRIRPPPGIWSMIATASAMGAIWLRRGSGEAAGPAGAAAGVAEPGARVGAVFNVLTAPPPPGLPRG